MSLDIDLYKKRLGAYKVGEKKGRVDSIKNSILNDFLNNPSHEEVIINGEKRDVHIVTQGVQGNKLLCMPNEDIQNGDYIVWKDKHFLCTHRFPDDKVQVKGTIQKCNYNLKWISGDTDELINRYCVEDGRTLYTTGIKDEKVMEIPNGMVGIQLPRDSETEKLKRGDTFVFNNTKYLLSFYDKTTYEGLIALICRETEPSHLDDKVNEIANRWVEINGERVDRLPWLDNQEPPIDLDPPTEPIKGISYEVTIKTPYPDDDPEELWYGETYEYTIQKFIDDEEVDGEFAFELSNNDYADISEITSKSCKVTAKDIYMGGNVTLIITDTETGEIAMEKEIKIEGM